MSSSDKIVTAAVCNKNYFYNFKYLKKKMFRQILTPLMSSMQKTASHPYNKNSKINFKGK